MHNARFQVWSGLHFSLTSLHVNTSTIITTIFCTQVMHNARFQVWSGLRFSLTSLHVNTSTIITTIFMHPGHAQRPLPSVVQSAFQPDQLACQHLYNLHHCFYKSRSCATPASKCGPACCTV